MECLVRSWQVVIAGVGAVVGILSLTVAILAFRVNRGAALVAPRERRQGLVQLIDLRLRASAREIRFRSEMAKDLARHIRLHVGDVVFGFAIDKVAKLHIPGAERFSELQKELRQVARGEDLKVLKYLEQIQIYEECLLRCEAAAREGSSVLLHSAAEALLDAANLERDGGYAINFQRLYPLPLPPARPSLPNLRLETA